MRTATKLVSIFSAVVLTAVLGLQPDGVAAETLSAAEARTFSAALKEVERGSKKRLDQYARNLTHPLARKIVSWYVLFQGGFGTEFKAIDAFISHNPDWPRSRRLMARAEEALDENADPLFIIDWFGGREPLTELGRQKLAGALLRSGRKEEGIALVRDVWINGDFPKAHEKAFYRKFRKHLTLADNRARADRLMWHGKYWPARRMIYRVDPKYRKLIQARTALRRNRGNVDYLVAQVPDALKNDPGLIFERLRWRRKKGLETAFDLLNRAPNTVPHPSVWWDERAVLARRLLKKGHISEAYRFASGHGLSPEDAVEHAEAEWFSGWIALRLLREPKRAIEHFKRMFGAVSYPVSRARGAYWTARAADDMGEQALAKKWYATAATFPTTYYGQLAQAKSAPGEGLRLPPEQGAGEKVRQRFDAHELVRAVRMLAAAGEEARLYSLILRIADLDPDPSWLSLTARLARLSGRSDLAIKVAKQALQDHNIFVAGGYPMIVPPGIPKRVGASRPETPLVLAVVRQESGYDPEAVSHAGARGLMQLMPATARVVAKRAGVRYSRVKLTKDPDYNLTLGQAYLADLIDDYGGYLPMAIAAYNAGPYRVRQWVDQFGDPRDPDVDPIDWIESIPFNETRNYVQRVLENTQVYRRRLADTEIALGLNQDLGR